MTSDARAAVDHPRSPSLAERVRASTLPPPAERRAIRQRAGVTLREVAAEIGVSPTAVLRWEQGSRRITRDYAIAYRRILDALRKATP